MSNIAIEFQNVGTGTLSHDLNRWWQMSVLGHEDPYLKIGQTNDRTKKGESEYVWALRDISFKVAFRCERTYHHISYQVDL